MSKVVCVIPGDSVERALQGENILIEDFVQMTRQDFILSTIYLMAEVGFSSLRRANEDLARRMLYNRMEMYNFWDVGMSSEEDELIAHVGFTYARYLLSFYQLDEFLCGIEISVELLNGDIYIYGH